MAQLSRVSFAYGRLLLWFIISHAAVALIALNGMGVMENPTAWAWVLMAGAIGIMALLPLMHAISIVVQALSGLYETQGMTPLSESQIWLLPSLMQRLNALITQHAGVGQLRGQLVHQVGEAAAQEERNRLARDLHDSIKQQIFSISVSAAAAQAHWQTNPERASLALNDVRQSAQEAMVEMRAMLQQLSPAPLEKSGLLQALRDQCEALAYRSGAQITTDFGDVPGNDQFPPGAQEALFRIAQEGLSNIARHARAQTVQVRFQRSDDQVTLVMTDDGQGFDPSVSNHGMGLDNIRKRVEPFEGKVDIESAIGHGTILRVTLPLVQPIEKDQTMMLIDKMFHQVVPALYGSALGLGGFIYGLSLVMSATVSTPKDIPFAFMLGLTIFAIISAVLGLRAFVYVRKPLAYLSLHTEPNSGWFYRLAQHQHQAAAIAIGISAWFLPLAWIGSPIIPLWVTPLIVLPLVVLVIWHLLQTQWAQNRYLALLHGQERAQEVERRHQARFNGWLSYGFLMGVLFLTGTWEDMATISVMPTSTDQWMTTFFIMAALILTGQLIYESWSHRVYMAKGEIV